MAELKKIIAYLVKNYPHKNELSKTRLTKLVYLADWETALKGQHQMTDIEWVFHNFGPYVDDVIDCVFKNKQMFTIDYTQNMYGGEKMLVRLKDENFNNFGLSDTQKQILDSVIEKTKSLFWDAFIKYVYDTYPIRVSDRYVPLDLGQLAKESKNEKSLEDILAFG